MSSVTRAAFKGYTYQHFIYWLLISQMDVNRNICSIEVEKDLSHNFDDCYLESNSKKYYFQVKNEKNRKGEMISLDEITVTDEEVILPSYTKISYKKDNNNILILNTNKIETNTEVLGFPASKLDSIYIVPLTPNKTQKIVDEMYDDDKRINMIIKFAYETTINSIFKVTLNDLPKLFTFSINLNENTQFIRDSIIFNQGINLVTGKPGVGKSHFVNELQEEIPIDIIYRFWVNSQDKYIRDRRVFKNFLRDLGSKVFKTPKDFKTQDLIDKINSDKLFVVIDGLDHVENHNHQELENFIDFIDKISKAKVLVLSRPLKKDLKWREKILDNWNFKETEKYLTDGHSINKYKLIRQIYDLSDGYPIITNFLAEHYKLHGKIPISTPTTEISNYYEKLIKDKDTKRLSIFLLNDYFFLEEEIDILLEDVLISDPIKEFIAKYPYLFNIILNRISLIHDSLNTFLREKNKNTGYFLALKNKILPKIKESIENEEIRYLARFDGFKFNNEFIEKILLKYSNIKLFKNLCNKNFDLESIENFYQKLQLILENYPNLFDIYQYYSFILILLIVGRINYQFHDDSLNYQVIKYMKRKKLDEKNIFSNSYLWKTFLCLIHRNERHYKKMLSDNHFDTDLGETFYLWNREYEFFDIFEKDVNEVKLEKYLDNSPNNVYENAITCLVDFIILIWLNKHENSVFYQLTDKYLKNEKDPAIKKILNKYVKPLKKYGIIAYDLNRIMPNVKLKLMELNVIKEDNIFLKNNLKEIIDEIAPKGSFEVSDYVKSYIRLKNYLNQDFNIFELSRYYTMYIFRKDYTVINIYNALITFENDGHLSYSDSIKLIESLMKQSEKGIRNLLLNYINAKEPEFTQLLIENNELNKNLLNIFQLDPPRLDYFNLDDIDKRMDEIFQYHFYGKNIYSDDIGNALKSKYKKPILDLIDYYGFSISEDSDEKNNKNRKPFENGYISKEDLKYIKNNNIKPEVIAKYADGWHHGFSNIIFYEHFDKKELREKCLDIIHMSLFAKWGHDYDFICSWYYFLGNIPKFLEMINYNTDWEKLYKIFIEFIKQSSIPYNY